ncbi:MAG: flagellar protein FlgN [Pseudomonadales bacterium]|nr:flagellar protein FlgN [Pseudomonadales bacterium]
MDADTPLFGELLETELSHYESLKSLLQQERELLVNREIEEFTVLLSRKHVLLSKLEEDNQARCQLLRAQQLPVNKSGVETLISNLTSEEADISRGHWQKLNSLIDECARLNDINARITHRAQSSSQQILNLLRGESAGFELYSKKGESRHRTGPLPITKV